MLLGSLLLSFVCAADVTPQWRLEPVLRIGTIEGENYALTWIGGLAVGPDNLLFVSQPVERHIKVFDRQGRFVRRIGREGGGPGEFRSIMAMSFVRGRLRVLDLPGGRLTDFAPDGRLLETHRTPVITVEPPFNVAAPIAVGADGTRYLLPGFRVSAQVDSVPFYTVAPGGEARTIAYLREGGRTPPPPSGRLVVGISLPVHGRTLYGVDPRTGDLVLIDRPLPTSSSRHTWRLLRVRVNGDTVLSRAFSYDPVAVPRAAAAAARDQEIQAALRRFETNGLPATRQEIVASVQERFRVPPFQAPVDSLVLGSSGELWVRRGGLGESVAEWFVLSADGNCIGRVRIPATARLGFATAQHVGLIEVDELEVNYAAIYRTVRR